MCQCSSHIIRGFRVFVKFVSCFSPETPISGDSPSESYIFDGIIVEDKIFMFSGIVYISFYFSSIIFLRDKIKVVLR